MEKIVQFVGPHHTLQLFGIQLVGLTAENGKKLLFSVIFLAGVYLLQRLLRLGLRVLVRNRGSIRVVFWTTQGIQLFTAIVMTIGLISIWFSDPKTLATALGLVLAGLAFAMQRAVLAFVGYMIILRGRTFNVGDRIVMGGVRGDVISLGFMQTTIMEMGEPPGEQSDAPSLWVHGRQYTGRVVTITNDKLFDSPVYNYSREFPYIWEEMKIPVPYRANRHDAERILLEVAHKHTVKTVELSREVLDELRRRHFLREAELEPHVFCRLTDNWVEMSLRFIARDSGIRALKDKMSRDILDAFDKVGIEIASGTYEVVGMPPIEVKLAGPRTANQA
jgi:small-conductance mechanosensitive channel